MLIRGVIKFQTKNFNLNQESNPGPLTLKTSMQTLCQALQERGLDCSGT